MTQEIEAMSPEAVVAIRERFRSGTGSLLDEVLLETKGVINSLLDEVERLVTRQPQPVTELPPAAFEAAIELDRRLSTQQQRIEDLEAAAEYLADHIHATQHGGGMIRGDCQMLTCQKARQALQTKEVG